MAVLLKLKYIYILFKTLFVSTCVFQWCNANMNDTSYHLANVLRIRPLEKSHTYILYLEQPNNML